MPFEDLYCCLLIVLLVLLVLLAIPALGILVLFREFLNCLGQFEEAQRLGAVGCLLRCLSLDVRATGGEHALEHNEAALNMSGENELLLLIALAGV